jgi:branched-chain amino acid transport system permease protein
MEIGGLLLYFVYLVTFAGIYAVMALGLNLNWGMTGLFNVGIAGFFAVGGYVSAILTAEPSIHHWVGFELPMPLGWLAALVASALIAWVVGRICLRLRSDYLAIATIGIAEILRLVARNEEKLTGGVIGIKGIPKPLETIPQPWDQIAGMLLVLGFVLLVYLFMERVRLSPWGRVMRAIRDNEMAAAAMGKDIEKFRLHAFVIGSAFMGFGGALTAHYLKVFSPDATEPLVATFLVWVMLIAGGSGNNRGAVLGALIVWLLWTATELLSSLLPTELGLRVAYFRQFLVGLLLIVVLQRFPGGLLPEQAPKLPEDNAAPPPR